MTTMTTSQDMPVTAVKRGRPPGPTKEIGNTFLNEAVFPFDQWITVTFADVNEARETASYLRNLAWRKGIGVRVLPDNASRHVVHILKYKKGNDNGTQE